MEGKCVLPAMNHIRHCIRRVAIRIIVVIAIVPGGCSAEGDLGCARLQCLELEYLAAHRSAVAVVAAIALHVVATLQEADHVRVIERLPLIL